MIIGTSGRTAFALGNKFETAHPGHIDVRQDQNERGVSCIADTLQRGGSRLSELHVKSAGAQIAPELLAKQHFDVGLIVNHENKKTYACPPDLAMDAAVRGRTILNSVNLPGSVLTTIEPACCFTMMS